MKKYDWSEECVRKAVETSNCWFDCLPKLGIPKGGCNYRTLKNKVLQYGIDTSHFSYFHAKGNNGRHALKKLCNRADSQLFSYGSRVKVDNLKKEYIRRILKGDAHCELCGIKEWQGMPLVFQIHHKDGDHLNHVRENLQLLCPNCHSQTDTFSNRKRLRYEDSNLN